MQRVWMKMILLLLFVNVFEIDHIDAKKPQKPKLHELTKDCMSAWMLNQVPFAPFHKVVISRNGHGKIVNYSYTSSCEQPKSLRELVVLFPRLCSSNPEWMDFGSGKGEATIVFALVEDGRCEPAINVTKVD